jgi:ribosomal protein L35
MSKSKKSTRKRWSKQDTQTLLETINNNPTRANLRRVAKALGRTAGACQFMYYKLNRTQPNPVLVNKKHVITGKLPKQIREIRITNDGIRLIY